MDKYKTTAPVTLCLLKGPATCTNQLFYSGICFCKAQIRRSDERCPYRAMAVVKPQEENVDDTPVHGGKFYMGYK